ncbi:DUF6538 domain-containing protein [Falsiroseomonas sp. CW058]|uniref:DUF6538 domain-containing protein n=1 Tax=Falsiroseomonas sp. CW058 TaxID=3388664 RepID=UPI003D3138BF
MGHLAPAYFLLRDRRCCIRLRVPLDLVDRLGRREIVRALGTADGVAGRLVTACAFLRSVRTFMSRA